MVLVWPLLMLEAVKFDGFRFLVWTTVSQIWTYLAATYIVIVPLYEEVREVYGQYLVNKAQRERHMPRSARQRSARPRGPGAPLGNTPFPGMSRPQSQDSLGSRGLTPPGLAIHPPSAASSDQAQKRY